jgi:hypothetical protein
MAPSEDHQFAGACDVWNKEILREDDVPREIGKHTEALLET